ncbi:hypothetical protein ALIPUT_00421 [Alistipes putredinis DSM 17216]|uniref:Uncharacterized protein n=1 Tax=Alistipes putredinis DSM 17216 TaxID=445970 RepID=B0MTC5_9BACT|nr:hypothetical protein ALIPUT_00421 [Alistipes putredinis DSM 17216]
MGITPPLDRVQAIVRFTACNGRYCLCFLRMYFLFFGRRKAEPVRTAVRSPIFG